MSLTLNVLWYGLAFHLAHTIEKLTSMYSPLFLNRAYVSKHFQQLKRSGLQTIAICLFKASLICQQAVPPSPVQPLTRGIQFRAPASVPWSWRGKDNTMWWDWLVLIRPPNLITWQSAGIERDRSHRGNCCEICPAYWIWGAMDAHGLNTIYGLKMEKKLLIHLVTG